jgi:hypothetical protein
MIPKTGGTYFGQSMTANYIYTIAGDGTVSYGGMDRRPQRLRSIPHEM